MSRLRREQFVRLVAAAFERVRDQSGPVEFFGPEPCIRFLEPHGSVEELNLASWFEAFEEADDPAEVIADLVQTLLPDAAERRSAARSHLPFEEVVASARQQGFDELLGPDLVALGFSRRRDGRYLRADGDDWMVCWVARGRGYRAGLGWGASLGCFPLRLRQRPVWKRSFAAAQVDLFESRSHYFDVDDLELQHGVAVYREDLQRTWGQRREQLLPWLDRYAGTAGKLELLEELRADGQVSSIVRPFLLARLGRAQQARTALQRLARVRAQGFLLGPHRAPFATSPWSALEVALDSEIERISGSGDTRPNPPGRR